MHQAACGRRGSTRRNRRGSRKTPLPAHSRNSAPCPPGPAWGSPAGGAARAEPWAHPRNQSNNTGRPHTGSAPSAGPRGCAAPETTVANPRTPPTPHPETCAPPVCVRKTVPTGP